MLNSKLALEKLGSFTAVMAVASLVMASAVMSTPGHAAQLVQATQETASSQAGPQGKTETPTAARAAAQRSIALLQSSAAHWTNEVGCFSCHHQGIGGLTVALAEEAGLSIDRAAAANQVVEVYGASRDRFEALLVGDGVGVFGRGTTLLALGVRNRPKDSVTDAIAAFLAARQTATGAWYSNEHRPPFEDSHVTATALTVRSLALYGPEKRAAEMKQRIARAQDWLQAAAPKDNEERTMRILGLAWCGVEREQLARDCEDLLAKQRDDGGWAQLPTMASDAYATGQALVVLHQVGGLSAGQPAWARGMRYLLDNQRSDGTWFVATRRRIKGQRPRDSGFPYGADQFSSYMGSSWAVMALALADLEPTPTRAFFGPAPRRAKNDPVAGEDGLSPLHRAAAFGSLEDVRQLLKAGAQIDVHGPRGVTPLMLAVHDLAKVDLLLEHGADPDASSEWGFTPLLSATLVEGAGPVVDRLLELDVAVDCRGANGSSPLLCVASVSDVVTLRTLLNAGAEFPGSQLNLALVYAATCGDVSMGRVLVEFGADPNALVGSHPPAVIAAAISGYADFVRFALSVGADTEVRDKRGMTAIAWAAKIDPGHTCVLQTLIDAGADVNAEDSEKRTPLDWARRYGNKENMSLLRASGASFGRRARRSKPLDEQHAEDRRYDGNLDRKAAKKAARKDATAGPPSRVDHGG